MKQLHIYCTCGIDIRIPLDSGIAKQLFPMWPLIPSQMLCVQCGYCPLIEVEEIEKEKQNEN